MEVNTIYDYSRWTDNLLVHQTKPKGNYNSNREFSIINYDWMYQRYEEKTKVSLKRSMQC